MWRARHVSLTIVYPKEDEIDVGHWNARVLWWHSWLLNWVCSLDHSVSHNPASVDLALWRILTSCVRNAWTIYFFVTTTLLSFALFNQPNTQNYLPKERAPFLTWIISQDSVRITPCAVSVSYVYLPTLAREFQNSDAFQEPSQLLASVPHHSLMLSNLMFWILLD